MKKTCLFLTGLIGLFSYQANATEVDFSGYLEGELRYYPNEALLEEQRDWYGSIAFEPELDVRSDDESHIFKTKLFGRWSPADGNRSHGDIREFYYTYAGSGWQFQMGINKIFWGVVESAHLVDIVNQTDNLESINGEEKLGQPLISFGIEQDWGNWDFYILPYFRVREFNQEEERFQFTFEEGATLPIDEDDNFFESSHEESRVDFATRWNNYYGNLDIAISYFNGTSRDPLPVLSQIVLVPTGPSTFDVFPSALGNYYELSQQLGLELQYLLGDWALKFEGTRRWQDSGHYNSVVTGFEYTFSDTEPFGADVGILVEYLYNNREEVSVLDQTLRILDESGAASFPINRTTVSLLPADQQGPILALDEIPGHFFSPMDNDIFMGTRFTLNDIAGTQFVAGIIVDADDQTTSGSFEGSTRIGDDIRITVNAYFFVNVDENSSFKQFEEDDQIEVKFAWYF